LEGIDPNDEISFAPERKNVHAKRAAAASKKKGVGRPKWQPSGEGRDKESCGKRSTVSRRNIRVKTFLGQTLLVSMGVLTGRYIRLVWASRKKGENSLVYASVGTKSCRQNQE